MTEKWDSLDASGNKEAILNLNASCNIQGLVKETLNKVIELEQRIVALEEELKVIKEYLKLGVEVKP